VSIILNTRDIKHCQQVAHLIGSVTAMCHGIHAAESIMRKAVPTKRQIQADKNYVLLQAAKGRIAEKAAVDLAEQNKSLPHDQRYGPTGTTSASTMAQQIRRLRKKQKR
jgi:hypothetical protein